MATINKHEVYIVPPKPTSEARRARTSSSNKAAFGSFESRFLPKGEALTMGDIEWAISSSPNGAKSAYNALKDISENEPESRDWDFLQRSKGYFIFTNEQHAERSEVLRTMMTCNIKGLKPRTVGCLLLGVDTYVFFWPRS